MPAIQTKPARLLSQQRQLVFAHPVRTVAGGLLVLLPIVMFAWVWQHYAVNVPKWDDHALRAYLYFSDQETTLSGKIYQLFKQHNEHRIVYDRIITALDYRLFGRLSYRHLMVVGNLSLVGLLAVFGAVLFRAGKSLIYLAPVSLLLFNLAHWENMFWGMAALQNFSVVFWVLATLYCLAYTNRWGIALLLAVLASITSGNGLLVWPLGLVLVALRPDMGQQSGRLPVWLPVRPLIAWAVSAVVVIGLYFVGFESPDGNPPLRATAGDLLKGWLVFTGAAADVLPSTLPLRTSTRLGTFLVLATLGVVAWGIRTQWATIRRFIGQAVGARRPGFGTAREVPPVMLFLWTGAAFLLGTAAVVAWTRTSFGMELLTTSRYKIYSLTLLALLYVYTTVCLPRRAGRWVLALSTAGSLFIAWLSYNAFIDDTIWWRHWMLTRQFNDTHGTNQPISRVDSVSARYTTLAPAFYDTDPARLYGDGQLPAVPITVTETPAGFAIQEATLPVQDKRDGRSFLVARSPTRTYLFPTRQNQYLSGRNRFWPADLFTDGFTAVLAPVDFEAGTYQLFVLTVAPDGQLTLHATGRTITSVGAGGAPLKKNW